VFTLPRPLYQKQAPYFLPCPPFRSVFFPGPPRSGFLFHFFLAVIHRLAPNLLSLHPGLLPYRDPFCPSPPMLMCNWIALKPEAFYFKGAVKRRVNDRLYLVSCSDRLLRISFLLLRFFFLTVYFFRFSWLPDLPPFSRLLLHFFLRRSFPVFSPIFDGSGHPSLSAALII